MLYISFKCSENTLELGSNFFDMNYMDEWFEDEMVKEMVLDVDKSIIRSPYCIESPVLGQIAPTKISGGVKILILMLKMPELEFYATSCGDNCAKWIIKISQMNDLHIVLEHLMHFNEDFEGYCVDLNQSIRNLNDYGRCAVECL